MPDLPVFMASELYKLGVLPEPPVGEFDAWHPYDEAGNDMRLDDDNNPKF